MVLLTCQHSLLGTASRSNPPRSERRPPIAAKLLANLGTCTRVFAIRRQHLNTTTHGCSASKHQHSSTSAHQHISTSTHQHISTSAHQYFQPLTVARPIMLSGGTIQVPLA
eukprot:2860641-Rhodomonas_salina.1